MRCSATRRNGRNMTSMEKTGNTPTSSKPNSSNIANIKTGKAEEPTGAAPATAANSPTSSNRCSAAWVAEADAATVSADKTTRQNCRSLTDAAKTHKQIITVNGKNLRITIPAGIADGQTIKLRGQGGPGVNGGPAGDLYITFHIPEDSRFKRVGDDLYVTVPLNLYTAILGGEQIVETMDSKAKLKVKPGTQNNTKVRLRGKGFPVYKEEGKFGDMIVTYSIDIPTNLTDKQKELFREIQSLN